MAVMPDAALHGERAPDDFALRLQEDNDGLFLDSLRGTVGKSHNVLAWVANRDDVDPDRIGAVGVSMGGAVALDISCQKRPLAPKVAVAFMPATPRPGSAMRQEAVYAPDPAACFPTALLIMHGTEDRVAPYPNACSFYVELVPHYSAAPERLRFVDMSGEGHHVGAYWIEETFLARQVSLSLSACQLATAPRSYPAGALLEQLPGNRSCRLCGTASCSTWVTSDKPPGTGGLLIG